MKTTDAVTPLVEGLITSMGYELVDVEFKKEQANWVLTFYIYKEGGVTVEDCEAVSRAVEPVLDEADPIPQAYYLSVSSPGLDRPLKTEKDYLRNLHQPVTVKLYAQVDKKKEFTGTLEQFSGDAMTIRLSDGRERVFSRKDIAQVKPYIDFH